MKVYLKKGNTNYKEKRLVSKLQEALAKKIESDPSFESKFKPATTFEELKQLHNEYCIDEVQFEEVENKDIESEHKSFRDSLKPEKPETSIDNMKKDNNKFDNSNSSDTFIDPLNREEPIIRDYVNKDEFPNPDNNTQSIGRTKFDEPMSFKESFEIPSSDFQKEERGTVGNLGSDDNKNSGPSKSKAKNQGPPVNPEFGDMSTGKQKKSTRKFAKYIVEAICMMSEKGFVWYANKDITETKLAEYELNGEMDLSILVTLQDGQQATVKEFFLSQCIAAAQLSTFSDEEKKDLAESLAAVLDEKGVAPTPTQELIMVGIGMFATKGIAIFALKSSTNSLLNQLRSMKQDNQDYQQPKPRQEPVQQPIPQPQQQSEPELKKEVEQEKVIQKAEPDFDEGNFESFIIDTPIKTLE